MSYAYAVWISVVLGVAALMTLAASGLRVSACLALVTAGMFVRPSFAADSYDYVGLGLLALAALLALATDGDRRIRSDGLGRTVWWLTVAYSWLMLHALVLDAEAPLPPLFLGFVLTVGGAAAAFLVLREPSRARLTARLAVFLLCVVAASYLATVVLWLLQGPGTGAIGTLPLGSGSNRGQVFAPFTVTLGETELAGQSLPRLTGIGREPGIMGLYFAAGYFLARPAGLGWKSRALLLAGLVGTWSTGALAVFLPVWAYDRFWKRARPIARLLAIPAAAATIWATYNAPVFGLRDKFLEDPYSVADRQLATEAGWSTLWNSPLTGAEVQIAEFPAVNLIASVAAFGLPFAVACALALWRPSRTRPGGSTVALAVFLTLLTTQPARDSLWVFVLAIMGYAMTPAVTRHGHRVKEDASRPSSSPMAASGDRHAR